MKNMTYDQFVHLAQLSFVRMDGAWFMAAAKKYGIQAAWELDVEAWKQFSYVMGKNLRKHLVPEPVWPDSFLEAMDVFMSILGIKGRSVSLEGGSIYVRVNDCEVQKGIAKAGIADCGIVTIETYTGMVQGLFGKETDISVRHTKNLNRGDGLCEVVITRKS